MLTYLEVIYQEQPIAPYGYGFALSPLELRMLSIEAFPRSPPPCFKPWEGLKIFSLGPDKFGVARVICGSDIRDRFGRPTMKAFVLMGLRQQAFLVLRDLEFVWNFLEDPGRFLEASMPSDLASALMEKARAHGLFYSDHKVKEFLAKVTENPEFAVSYLSTIYKAKVAEVIASSFLEPLSFLMAFMPLRALAGLEISTLWDGHGTPEDVIVLRSPSYRKCPKIYWHEQRVERKSTKKEFKIMIDFLRSAELTTGLSPAAALRLVATLTETGDLASSMGQVLNDIRSRAEAESKKLLAEAAELEREAADLIARAKSLRARASVLKKRAGEVMREARERAERLEKIGQVLARL